MPRVTQDAPQFEPDEIAGYEAMRFALPEEDDGPLWATLVRKTLPVSEAERGALRPAVVYLHGFCDYFFQTHVAEAIERAGYRFYALELRRYGRSIAKGNRINQARDVSDYFYEIDRALRMILEQHSKLAGVIAHSTGGLIFAHYCREGQFTGAIPCLVLNSPFLRFNVPRTDRILIGLVAWAARFAPYMRLPQKMQSTYGETLHDSERGAWSYNLEYKPIHGFPLYPAWFRMILSAHSGVERGLDLRLPILSMRSDSSHLPGATPEDEDFRSDIVLDVDHIRELSPRLGPQVTELVIDNGIHDLYLSLPEPRARALEATLQFLERHNR